MGVRQVIVSPPILTLPVQVKLRSKMSGSCSMAAAVVTTLNTEPGVNVEERTRFMYTPS